ncbi:uncharacterized protein LOC143911896 [Arctopsyche grandis]|uniref:uncharacterized protein LOC143911896 n=1 Tax=Arctopsyche grandis TaxID=121162 RepID=UPI00406D9FF8
MSEGDLSEEKTLADDSARLEQLQLQKLTLEPREAAASGNQNQNQSHHQHQHQHQPDQQQMMQLPEPSELADELELPCRVVTDLWDSIGIHHPRQLLLDLGFKDEHLQLNNLLNCMEEEILTISSNFNSATNWNSSLVLFKAVVCLYRYDIDKVKVLLNQAVAERNKLKIDLSDANRRAAILANDIDENHSKLEFASKNRLKNLEQKHYETVQQLTTKLDSEKDQSAHVISNLEMQLTTLQNEELKLKSRLDAFKSDNDNLEKENNSLRDRLSESTELSKKLTKEVKLLTDSQKFLGEYRETTDTTIFEERILKLKEENTLLRDKNDEISAELEILISKSSSKLDLTNESFLSCSPTNIALKNLGEECQMDLNESTLPNGNAVKRRGLSPSVSQFELLNEEESPRICKLRKCHNAMAIDNTENIKSQNCNFTNTNNIQSFTDTVVDYVIDKKLNCENKSNDTTSDEKSDLYISTNVMETILHHLKDQNCCNLLKIINQSKYKPYYIAFYYLLHEIKNDISQIPIDDYTNTNDLTKIRLCLNEMNKLKLDTNYDKGYIESKVMTELETLSNPLEELCLLESGIQYELITTKLQSQIASLQKSLDDEKVIRKKESVKNVEKCHELEANLESLRAVYEESEEYWATKLKEEREIFEQEQQMSDEKFSDLMNKVSEYEEQFALHDNKNEFRNRPLSTIDEKCSLEKQFTDLEDEFEEFKKKSESEIDEKILEITCLQEKIEFYEKKNEDLNSNSANDPQINLTNPIYNTPKIDINVYNRESPDKIGDSDPITSPIEYLWNQKTISSPLNNNKSNDNKARDYQNPIFLKDQKCNLNIFIENSRENHEIALTYGTPTTNDACDITPIQKPDTLKSISSKNNTNCNYVNCYDKKLEGKILHCADLEQALQGRQKLNQEQDTFRNRFNPVMNSFNAQRLSQQDDSNARGILELQYRQLQTAFIQQQTYAETMMQQTLAIHRGEIGALRQKLAAADLLIRDLYVENCHLTKNIINPPII